MTVRQRIRAVTDALAEGEWLRVGQIAARVEGSTYSTIQVNVTAMHRAGQLRRRGKRPNCEYRSGPTPVVDLRLGRPLRTSVGFAELARLHDEDPQEFARLTRNDRGFRQ